MTERVEGRDPFVLLPLPKAVGKVPTGPATASLQRVTDQFELMLKEQGATPEGRDRFAAQVQTGAKAIGAVWTNIMGRGSDG